MAITSQSTRRHLAAAVACLLLCCQVSDAYYAVEKGKLVKNITRGRDCSPWGIDGANLDAVNPAFRVNFDDPLNHCLGVINYYYYFKVLIFIPQLETSLQMRAVKAFAEVMWNVNAHFRDKATDSLGGLRKNPARRRPRSQRTVRNKNIAIAFALSRVTAYLIPDVAADAQVILEALMRTTKINPNSRSTDFTTPQGIGNLCAQELIAYLKTDGWNSEGDMSPNAPFPYYDYTGYVPKNPAHTIVDPGRWQPLLESNQNGYYQIQTATTPQLRSGRVKTWAVPRAWVNKRQGPGPGWDSTMSGPRLGWLKGNATRLLRISASLTDTQKLLAEFFDNKIVSYGGFERLYAYQRKWCHDQWIEFEQMSACFYDATILAWKEKIRTDAIRPMSAIRWLTQQRHLPPTVAAWGGPGKGTRTIPTGSWQSFLRTMPHTEWPSGTSCLCQVFTEWIALYNKGDRVNIPLKWKRGCSATEPGATPKADLSYTFTSLKEMNRICSTSRQWAGVHFDASLKGGHDVCSGIAAQCYRKVQRMKQGSL